MIIAYKYNFWKALAKVAPSPEEQERMFYRLSTDMGLTTRQLKGMLNIRAGSNNDMPATAFLWLCIRLDIKPEKAINYRLPDKTMYEEMTAGSGIKKKFNLSNG